MKDVKAALETIDAASAKASLDRTGEFKLQLSGSEFVLTAEDVEINMSQAEGFNCQRSGDVTIALSTTLTPELIEEGFVREIISKVQTMRRDSNFEVTDRIKIYVDGNEKIVGIMQRNDAEINRVTLCDDIISNVTKDMKTWNINGEEVLLAVVRS